MKKFFSSLVLATFISSNVFASSTRTVDADYIKSSDHSKTWTMPASTGTVALTSQVGGGSGGVNILQNYNPEFESSSGYNTNWTASGGTSSAATSTDILFDTASYTWDSSSASQTLCSNLTAIPEGLKGTNGEAYVWTKVPSGTATHLLQVSDGTNTLISVSITSTSTASKQRVNFPIPTSGSLKICLVSVASNEPSIDVDKAYLGEATNVASVENISDWQDFPSLAYGTLWTATGTAGAYGTIAQHAARWRKVGSNMEIEWDYRATTAGTAGTGMLLFNLPSGYSIDTTKKPANSGATTSAANFDSMVGTFNGFSSTVLSFTGALYVYSSTQLKIQMTGHASGSNGPTFFGGGGAYDFSSNAALTLHFTASVPIQGWSTNQSAAAANQTNYGWTDWTPTLTGFGTATVNKCQHKRDAEDILLRCTFTAGTSTATEARLSLPNSLVSKSTSYLPTLSVIGQWARDASGAEAGTVLIEPALGYITFGHGFSGAAGLAKLNGSSVVSTGGVLSLSARVPIEGWTENNKAPTLIGSVTSDAPDARKIESAQIATNCSVASSSSSWITANTGSSTGTGCTFTLSGYGANPRCIFTAQASNRCVSQNSAAPTSTTLALKSLDCTDASAGASIVDIICMGPR